MCQCKQLVNDNLKAKNAILEEISIINLSTRKVRQSIVIKTEKLDRSVKKWTKSVVPSYCPFCGEKYQVES